jgi:hypothetical protein
MADWRFESLHRDDNFVITVAKPTFGDAFSPPVPADKLSTLNWTVKGRVKLYAADMTFLGEYGPGEKMLVPDPAHLAMGKAVLIAASADVEYYCLSASDGGYLEGDVVGIQPDTLHSFTGIQGKIVIVAAGRVSTANKTFTKGSLVHVKNIDAIDVTAGPNGAILTVFNKTI